MPCCYPKEVYFNQRVIQPRTGFGPEGMLVICGRTVSAFHSLSELEGKKVGAALHFVFLL